MGQATGRGLGGEARRGTGCAAARRAWLALLGFVLFNGVACGDGDRPSLRRAERVPGTPAVVVPKREAPDADPGVRDEGDEGDSDPETRVDGPEEPALPTEGGQGFELDVQAYLQSLADGEAVNPAMSSSVCGDGRFHALPAGQAPGTWVVEEECDDGNDDERDLCTAACQVSDTLVEFQVPYVEPSSGRSMPWLNQARSLGEGRHPVGANGHGFAVAYVEPGDVARVGVSVFDASGSPQAPLDASAFTSPVLFANPVVAGRLDGSFVVAYTDFEGDEDVLGVALTEIDPEAGSAVPMGYANTTREFSQYDADILAIGEQLVVAWTDDRDAVDGPDIYYRVIGSPAAVDGGDDGGEPTEPPPGLTPGDERPLAVTPALEGNVALARLGASWGAAWRASAEDGLETIEIRDFSTGLEWTIAEHLPGLAEDRPALVELTEELRLVLFTSGVDTAGGGPSGMDEDGVATLAELRYALLDTAAPGAVTFQPVTFPLGYTGSAGRGASHPGAVRVGDAVYLSWRSGAEPGSVEGEDVWLMEVTTTLDGGGDLVLTGTEARELPRWPALHSGGDQRLPALAALPDWPEGHWLGTPALVAAWVDYGGQFGDEQGNPDVIVQLSPTPSHRRERHQDCVEDSTELECGVGEGRCDPSGGIGGDGCADTLICRSDAGPNYGWGWDFPVCVPPSCIQGDAVICGGGTGQCGICHCPDGIHSEYLGEECDDGGFSPECTTSCSFSECGDGLVNAEAGEQCEPSLNPSCDPITCTLPGACTDPATCFSVWSEMQLGPTEDHHIQAHIMFVNQSTEAVDLDRVKVRYWFTRDHDRPMNTGCDGGATGGVCDIATLTLVSITPVAGADHYLQFDFNGSAPVIPAGATDYTQYQAIVNLISNYPDPYVTFNEWDDYSWTLAPNGDRHMVPNPHITAYLDGALVWGTEPGVANTPVCGNSLLEFGEECDDGNTTPGDGCDEECQREPGPCGNGILNAGEECDDGNTTPGDGCSATCQIETAFCGDGTVNQPSEECDDGNTLPYDGCSPTCQLECGNGVLEPGEVCDPGIDSSCNSTCSGYMGCTDGDSCLSVWTVAQGTATDNQINPVFGVRNNGTTTVPLSAVMVRYWFTKEGSGTLGYACSTAALGCSNINGQVYAMSPAAPGATHYLELRYLSGTSLAPGQATGPVQGAVTLDTLQNFNELDDFSYRSNTTAMAHPKTALYVNGVLVWGEEPGGGGTPYCGDGVVNQPGEECDTGAQSATCDGDCTLPVCGDGTLNPLAGEECDDGNASNSDACVAGCEAASCGDGYLRTGVEVCDPGLESGCLSDCSGYAPAGCTTLATCFGALHQMSGSATDNALAPYFKVQNNGTQTIDMTQVRLRYWFSAEATSPSFATNCDWAELKANTGINSCNIVQRSVTAVGTPDTSASHYLDLTFGAGAPSLAPGESSGPIQIRVNKTDWQNFNESNDYSNTQSSSAYAAATRVALYVGGTLVWGTEW